MAERDPLPEAWFPPAPLDGGGTGSARNRLGSLLQRYGLRPAGNPFTARGRTWLQKQKLPAAAGEYVERTWRLHDFFSADHYRTSNLLDLGHAGVYTAPIIGD